MRLRTAICACALLSGLALSAQEAAPQPSSPQQQQQSSDDQAQQKPKRSLKKHLKDHFSSWCIGSPVSRCFDHQPTDAEQQQVDKENAQGSTQPKDDAQKQPAKPATKPDPSLERDGESSSRSSIIDLTPPPSERRPSQDADISSDVREVQKWDPHRAMKDVEVGDYYFNRGNYRAAQSRYEEALEWKPNDAVATFRLAETEEKLKLLDAARGHYEQYLKILPHGPQAAEAEKAIARLSGPNAKQ